MSARHVERVGIAVEDAGARAEAYLRNLLRALQAVDARNEYVVYTNRENAGTFDLRAPRFREVRFPLAATNRPARILWEQTLLPLQAWRDRLDVLYSPGYTAPLLTSCASVVMIYDVNYRRHPEAWSRAALLAHRLLIPRVVRRATHVLTCSNASKGQIVELLAVPEAKVSVVYLGVDGNLVPVSPEDEHTVRKRFALEGEFLLAVSGTHPHKNLDGLIRVYDRLARSWPAPPPLVIVGARGAHQTAIERLLHERTAPGRVLLGGWVSDRELSALYRGSRLLVFPTLYEGFGLPPLEAMSVGVPVVSSNVWSLPEVVGQGGLLVDPADEAAMAAAVRRVWDDEALRRDLVERGYAQARRFTWRRTAIETIAALEHAAAA